MRPGIRATLLVALSLCLLVPAACSESGGPDGETAGPDAKLESALAAHAEGRLDEAASLYQQVLALDPDNKFAYYNLGLIDQTEGRIDAAAANYTEALTIDPDFGPALFNLAIIRADQGSTDEAIDLYRRVLVTNPEDAAAHLNLGFLLLDIGQRKEGRAELVTAVGLDPSLESRIPDGLVVVVGATGP
jgi:tetratricopeptide (TPR) repeat protein